MEITVLSVLGLLGQIAGLIYFCRLGARLCDKLNQKSRWLPAAVGCAFVVIRFLVSVFAGKPLEFVPQTASLFSLFFGGGMVARLQYRIFGR